MFEKNVNPVFLDERISHNNSCGKSSKNLNKCKCLIYIPFTDLFGNNGKSMDVAPIYWKQHSMEFGNNTPC